MNALTKCSAEYPVRFYQNILVIEHKQKAYFAIYMKGWPVYELLVFFRLFRESPIPEIWGNRI